MIPATTGGLDREQVRQVIMNIGRPLPRSRSVLADLVSAWSLVPRRTLMLLILLGLAALLGLTARAEPVKKGQGGVAANADNPLRDRADFFGPCARTELYNFLQNFPIPCAPQSLSPVSAPAPAPVVARAQRPAPGEPTKLLTALAFIVLLILWIHLRSTRTVQEVSRPPRSRRIR